LLYLASIPQEAILESVDARGYDLIARNLLDGHGFSLRAETPYQPDGLRTPLYPLFVSAVYALVGVDDGPLAVALAQAVLDSLTALLVGALTGKLWGRRGGALAALLYALTPLQWRYSAALLTEIPLAFLLSLALWFWVTKDERRTTKTRSRRRNVLRPPSFVPPALRAAASVRPVLCGAVAGLAALCKPNVSGLALLLALAALWERRGRWRQALIEAGSILLAAAVVVSPWVLRNWAVFGRPFLSNAHLGYVARVTAPATLGVVEGHQVAPWSPEWEARYVQVVSQAAARNDWRLQAEELTPQQADARERQMAAVAWEIVYAHPWQAARAHLVGSARSWAPQEQAFWYAHLSGRPWETLGVATNAYRDAVEILCDGRPGEAFEFGFVRPWERLDPLGRVLWYGWGLGHVLMLVLMLAGLWRLRRRPALAFVLAATILYATLPPGPIGYERFRVPVMPLITVLDVLAFKIRI
jgi:4-amino-4-deoxy-L-arabinose transferase-like glycosyltransferase